MFCSNCGNKLSPDAKFCTKCGQKVISHQEIEQLNNINADNEIKVEEVSSSKVAKVIFFISLGVFLLTASIFVLNRYTNVDVNTMLKGKNALQNASIQTQATPLTPTPVAIPEPTVAATPEPTPILEPTPTPESTPTPEPTPTTEVIARPIIGNWVCFDEANEEAYVNWSYTSNGDIMVNNEKLAMYDYFKDEQGEHIAFNTNGKIHTYFVQFSDNFMTLFDITEGLMGTFIKDGFMTVDTEATDIIRNNWRYDIDFADKGFTSVAASPRFIPYDFDDVGLLQFTTANGNYVYAYYYLELDQGKINVNFNDAATNGTWEEHYFGQ